jgi:hypothetical protein
MVKIIRVNRVIFFYITDCQYRKERGKKTGHSPADLIETSLPAGKGRLRCAKLAR